MTHFSVPKMTCGHCKKTVEEALTTLDSGAAITVDLEKHEVDVSTVASVQEVIASLKNAGYEAMQL